MSPGCHVCHYDDQPLWFIQGSLRSICQFKTCNNPTLLPTTSYSCLPGSHRTREGVHAGVSHVARTCMGHACSPIACPAPVAAQATEKQRLQGRSQEAMATNRRELFMGCCNMLQGSEGGCFLCSPVTSFRPPAQQTADPHSLSHKSDCPAYQA